MVVKVVVVMARIVVVMRGGHYGGGGGGGSGDSGHDGYDSDGGSVMGTALLLLRDFSAQEVC